MVEGGSRGEGFPWRAVIFAAVFVAALPFGAGAVVLTWQYISLPPSAGTLLSAQYLGAALWVFGFWTGLMGTSLALLARSMLGRKLGTSLVVFGCAHIALGVLTRRYVEARADIQSLSLSPFLVPLAMWVYAIAYALRASAPVKDKARRDSAASEELQQPQSPP